MADEMAFLQGAVYREAVEEAIREAHELSVAVAFWGDGSQKLIDAFRGRGIRVVCNLASGGSNPKAIRALRERFADDIRQLDQLHAKLLIADDIVIVGSGNFSSNGLGLEGAEAAWEEAGLRYVHAPSVGEACAFFERIWSSARAIDDTDLTTAEERWKARRTARPLLGARGKKLIDFAPHELKDRNARVVIYRVDPSEAAKAEYCRHTGDKQPTSMITTESGRGFYEDWPTLRSSDDILPIEYYDNGSPPRCWPAEHFADESHFTSRGKPKSIQITRQAPMLAGLRFDAAQRRALNSVLKDHIKTLWREAKGDRSGRELPLSRAVEILQRAIKASSK